MQNNVSVVRLNYMFQAEALVRDCPMQKWALCAPGVDKIKIWRLDFHFVVARASDQGYLQLKQEIDGSGQSTQIEIAV